MKLLHTYATIIYRVFDNNGWLSGNSEAWSPRIYQERYCISVYCSGNIVSEVLSLAGNLHVSWPLDDNVTNESMESLFYLGRNKDNEEIFMPDYPKFHRELAKKGVTITLLLQYRVLFGSQCGWQKHIWAHRLMITIMSMLYYKSNDAYTA